MVYQRCRWYDPYPKLRFVLEILRFTPVEVQMALGEQLLHYLSQRNDMVPKPVSMCHRQPGYRWYDRAPQLSEALDYLKLAPHLVKLQASEFLDHSIQNLAPYRSGTYH